MRIWRRAVRLINLLLTPMWVLLVLILRALHPIIPIRIGGINAGRLGHLVMDLEMFLAEKSVGIHSTDSRLRDIRYVWTDGLPIANEFILHLWRPLFKIGPAWLLQPIDGWNRRIPGGEKLAIPYRKGPKQLNQHNDLHGALRATDTHLPFRDSHMREAQDLLKNLKPSFSLSEPYVCIHVRDSAYFSDMRRKTMRDESTRNAAIISYLPAIRYLLSEGFGVVRIGSAALDRLPLTDAHFWDYASDGSHNDLLDVALISKCTFFISTMSGPDKIAQAFRKPILFTNLAPLKSIPLCMPRSLFAPKRLVDDAGRTLTWGSTFRNSLYELGEAALFERQIRLEPNTPSELLDSTAEMVLELRNGFVARPPSAAWSEFLELTPPYLKAGGANSRMTEALLRDRP